MAETSNRTFSCAAMTRSSFRRPGRVALLLPLVVGAWSPSRAAEWSFQPAMQLSMDHQTNRSLTEGGEAGAGLVATIDAQFEYRTERVGVTATAGTTLQRYSGQSYTDSNDRALALVAGWQTETGTLDLSLVDRTQNTLLADLAETSFLDAGASRRDRSVTVDWASQLSARTQFAARVSLTDVGYGGRTRTLLPGYRYPAATARLARQAGARLRWFADASLSELRLPGAPFTTRDTGASGGIDYALGERIDLSLGAGYSRTDDGRQSDADWTGRARLAGTWPRASWAVELSRSVQPSGLGALVRRTDASASYAIDLSPRLRLVTAGRQVRNDAVLGARSGERRRVVDLEARAEWRMTADWRIALEIGHARTGGGADVPAAVPAPADAEQHGWRSGVTVDWSPQRRSISR